ncbi:MAG: thiazole synthase [Spirochaetia bacterium]|nr:thiazole synthase [Spirochaetia bacterium]
MGHFPYENSILEHDPLVLGKKKLFSRLLLGTGKYSSLELMRDCHRESGTEMVTLALRRVPLHLTAEQTGNITAFIDSGNTTILPNTAGAHSCLEALRMAALAVEMGMKFLKVEVMGDVTTLLPDPVETLKSVEELRKKYSSDELFLMVYTSDDPVMAGKLLKAGADAIMPAGSPIGSGRGIQNISNMKMILEIVNEKVPVILDAGVGCASDVTQAMELGMDAVLLNTAIAQADNPLQMASAMKHAWISGRLSYLAGRIPKKLYATASSPELDF